ncbi:MAG: ATP-grasp domain-containing protein [Bacteroidota bacterium]
MNNKVIIFHSEIPPDAPADELDVLDEAEFFRKELVLLGYYPVVMPFTFNMNDSISLVKEMQPDFVVNLVETAGGTGRLVHLAPDIFDVLRVNYTGSPAEAIYLTSNKIVSKKLMAFAGIPTPRFIAPGQIHNLPKNDGTRYIIKSLWEHASVGLDEHTMKLLTSVDEIAAELLLRKNRGELCFAEEFIDGREFNISMLGRKDGFNVLPQAEIRFDGYTDEMLKIVGYRSKWDESSYEYHHSNRSFDFTPADEPLLAELRKICGDCWNAFNLKGYVRVDFRIDAAGKPYVLEINANPCISPDSGFVAAASRAGLSGAEVISRIIDDMNVF